MRRAIPWLMLLAGCTAPPAPRGGGIVSTNPCADAMLVELVPLARIAAISRYSQDPVATSMPLALARRLRATGGTAEEVIALHPDLVVTSIFTPAATRAAYQAAGLRVVALDSPTSIAASRAQLEMLAKAVGAEDRGRALLARIDAAVRAAAPPAGARPSALLLLGGGLVNGPGNLLDELMQVAGFSNAAAGYGLRYSAHVSTEIMARAPPMLLIASGAPDRQQQALDAVLGQRVRHVGFARQLMNCGGPTIIPAVARFAAIRRAAR